MHGNNEALWRAASAVKALARHECGHSALLAAGAEAALPAAAAGSGHGARAAAFAEALEMLRRPPSTGRGRSPPAPCRGCAPPAARPTRAPGRSSCAPAAAAPSAGAAPSASAAAGRATGPCAWRGGRRLRRRLHRRGRGERVKSGAVGSPGCRGSLRVAVVKKNGFTFTRPSLTFLQFAWVRVWGAGPHPLSREAAVGWALCANSGGPRAALGPRKTPNWHIACQWPPPCGKPNSGRWNPRPRMVTATRLLAHGVGVGSTHARVRRWV
jgi:hypothetical protein